MGSVCCQLKKACFCAEWRVVSCQRSPHDDETVFHAPHRVHTRHAGKNAMVGGMRLFVYRQLVSISHPDKREVARTLGTLRSTFTGTSATYPAAKHYFAIVGEGEAYNQADWRNRSLSRFLQVVKVS